MWDVRQSEVVSLSFFPLGLRGFVLLLNFVRNTLSRATLFSLHAFYLRKSMAIS